ncbi:30S ribosomal protein S6 [Limnoglobus roseus]|uniref:Small ribosomal subunit protein bS6 n=1 Tax=Limnoglobus roseus TaxID=2598579 RepID=A0A5C1A974_9BACT|nr:30S ribosomal protein S6 [Limnoglobus roseus]QEL15270.1 30S ribosomal protein S6 [Limnoglobus roseus]
MPVVLYETLYAFDSTKVSADGDAIRGGLRANLEKYGAEIVIERPWDENGKLAYPINKQKKAYFYIVYYKMESTKQRELESDLRLNESLIRHMTINIDPKWAETVLDTAKSDHGRFALKSMQDDQAALGEGIISNDPLARGEGFESPPPNLNGPAGPGGPPRGRGPRRDRGDEKPE